MIHAHTHARQCMQVCPVNGLAYRALTNSRASSSEETGITARMGPNISLYSTIPKRKNPVD